MSDIIECDATNAVKIDENRDPLSGAHGAHPVGTGVGAAAGGIAAGAATGAVVGTMAGPIGTLAGAAIGVAAGAVVGGLAGKGVAEEINPTIEHDYWRIHYVSCPYAQSGVAYDEYAPAYQYGWESYARSGGQPFVEVESKLESGWDGARGLSKLGWDQAKDAVLDSWNRLNGQACTPAKSMMKKHVIAFGMAVTVLLLPAFLGGCDREVSHTTNTKSSTDGTVEKKETVVKESPDGAVTKQETTEKKTTGN